MEFPFLEALEVQTKLTRQNFLQNLKSILSEADWKAVLMQIQKAKFYASKQQMDRLEPALHHVHSVQ